MHAYVRRGLYGTLGAGGLLLLGAVGASADTTTTGSHGAASGTQVVTPVSAPAGAHDNAIAVLGRSSATRAGQPGGAAAAPANTGGANTSGSKGVGSGTQAIAPTATPVTAHGNAVSVLGRSDSSQSSSRSDAGSSNTTTAGSSAISGSRTSGERGAASGTQVVAPVSAPVSASGNAVSVLGRSSAVKDQSNKAPSGASSPSSGAASGSTTSGTRGVASGSQLSAPVSAPVTVTGNSIALLGSSSTGSGTAGTSGSSGKAGQAATSTPATSGGSGAASGTQALVPVAVPVAVDGNAISVLGRSSSTGTTHGTPAEDPAGAAYTRGASTSGSDGLGSGTQVSAPVVAPIAVGGNAVSVLGQSTARAPENSAAPAEGLPQGAGSGSGDTTGDDPAGSSGEPQAGVVTGDEPAGMPEEPASGEATFGVGGFGLGTHVGRPVAARVSADGNAGEAVSDASSAPDGDTSPGTPSGSSAGGLGSSAGAEGAAGSNDPCLANIALMSRATQDVKSAGLAGGNVAGTALSAVMFLLLGGAIARTLRGKGVRATA